MHRRECGGQVLDELRALLLHIAHPGRAAGCHQREIFARFQAAEEFLRFLAHREIRAEDRIVNFVRTHDLECRDELVEHIFARGQTIGLTDGDAHGGRDLDDDTLLRVVQGTPRRADVVFDGDGAGRAHGGALAAADAVRGRDGLVVACLNVQPWAAACKVQDAHALNLFAHAHAVAAEDAFVEVECDRRA